MCCQFKIYNNGGKEALASVLEIFADTNLDEKSFPFSNLYFNVSSFPSCALTLFSVLLIRIRPDTSFWQLFDLKEHHIRQDKTDLSMVLSLAVSSLSDAHVWSVISYLTSSRLLFTLAADVFVSRHNLFHFTCALC